MFFFRTDEGGYSAEGVFSPTVEAPTPTVASFGEDGVVPGPTTQTPAGRGLTREGPVASRRESIQRNFEAEAKNLGTQKEKGPQPVRGEGTPLFMWGFGLGSFADLFAAGAACGCSWRICPTNRTRCGRFHLSFFTDLLR